MIYSYIRCGHRDTLCREGVVCNVVPLGGRCVEGERHVMRMGSVWRERGM